MNKKIDNGNLVSVIIPVFNVEKYLPECLESVMNQDYQNLEIILINDGSTDNSGKICDKYAKQDKRIRIVHKTNSGVSDSRNIAIKQATGRLIVFIDSDDYIGREMISMLVSKYEKKSLTTCTYNMKYKNRTIENSTPLQEVNLAADIIPTLIDVKNNIGGFSCGRLYEKSIIDTYNIKFNKELTILEDIVFLTEYLKHVDKVLIIKKPLYYYRQRKNSATGLVGERIPLALQAIDTVIAAGVKSDVLIYWQKKYIAMADKKYRKNILKKYESYKVVWKKNIFKLDVSFFDKIKYLTYRFFGPDFVNVMKKIKNQRKYLYE